MNAANSSALAEVQSFVDSDLTEFVNLADELAELAGSITKKFFRYGSI